MHDRRFPRKQRFDVVAPWPGTTPREAATFGMYHGGSWRLLVPRPGTASENDPVRRLDVSVLQDRVLGPILGVGDPRTDGRIAFCGGITLKIAPVAGPRLVT